MVDSKVGFHPFTFIALASRMHQLYAMPLYVLGMMSQLVFLAVNFWDMVLSSNAVVFTVPQPESKIKMKSVYKGFILISFSVRALDYRRVLLYRTY